MTPFNNRNKVTDNGISNDQPVQAPSSVYTTKSYLTELQKERSVSKNIREYVKSEFQKIKRP